MNWLIFVVIGLVGFGFAITWYALRQSKKDDIEF